MATDLDDLFEHLLLDIALTGSRGLGAEEVKTTVKNHHDHLQLSSSTEAHASGGDLTSNSPSAIAVPDLSDLTASIWRRLEDHSDMVVVNSAEKGPDQRDDDVPDDSPGTLASDRQTSRRIFASEERRWQAIAGHSIDHKRIPPKMFDLLEVVAGAGPEGILQPDARRLTDQDKQSVPSRTDKLADRGYIIKEKVINPKLVTSRLTLWRFANEDGDTKHPAELSGIIDHEKCFKGICTLLRSNDGLAALSDIYLEIDCSSRQQKKALLRCIKNLESHGLWRRIRATGEDDEELGVGTGNTGFVRCLQLLREPSDADLDSMCGIPGGVIKSNDQDRRRKSRKPEPIEAGGGTESVPLAVADLSQNHTHKSEAAHQYLERAPSTMTSAQSEPQPDAANLKPAQYDLEPATRPSENTATATPPRSKSSQTKPPPAKKQRRMSLDKPPGPEPRESRSNATQADIVRSAIPDEPGVYFPPSVVQKRKVGRPRKSLVAVFKSDKLRDPSWSQRDSSTLLTAPSTHSKDLPIAYTSSLAHTQFSYLTNVSAAPDEYPTSALGVQQKTISGQSALSEGPQTPIQKDPGQPSKRTLGQLRRRERERAQKAASAAAAGEQTTALDLVEPRDPLQSDLPKATSPDQPSLLVTLPVTSDALESLDAPTIHETVANPLPEREPEHPTTKEHRLASQVLPTPPLENQDLQGCDNGSEEADEDVEIDQIDPLEDFLGHTRKRKRRRQSDAESSDGEYVDHGEENKEDEDEDEDEFSREASGAYNYTDHFPVVPNVKVRRTAAGSNAEARENGFVDAKARLQARSQLGSFNYHIVRRKALKSGNFISTQDLQSSGLGGTKRRAAARQSFAEPATSEYEPTTETQASPVAFVGQSESTTPAATASMEAAPPKKRGGWPKGKPRKAKPVQMASLGGDVSPLLALLFYPQQTVHKQSGTFGTSGVTEAMYQPTPSQGKSSKSSGTAGTAVVQSTASKKRSAQAMRDDSDGMHDLLMNPKQILHASSWTFGTYSTFGMNDQLDDARRGKRVRKSTEKAVTDDKLHEMGYKRRTTTTPTKRAPSYTKFFAHDDAERFSTDYVNSHPEENFYHTGHGRWIHGLPPPGTSYKTAVKGPDAKTYLAEIGKAEKKPKQHGKVVDGVQMKRDGTPWKRQPTTQNNERLKPVEGSTRMPQTTSTPQSTPYEGVPFVQYELPPSTLLVPPGAAPSDFTGPYAQQQELNYASATNPTVSSGSSQFSIPDQTSQAHQPLMTQQHMSVSPGPPTAPAAAKRKRPYTYRSRKQPSSVDPDGVIFEVDRESDEDYTQSRSPKRQRKQSQATSTPVKSKRSFERKQLSTAIALVRNLTPATGHKNMRWDLVGDTLRASDKGAAAEQQYKSFSHYGPHAKYVTAVQEAMQEPILAALEKGELPQVDHVKLDQTDWPGLLQWAEEHVLQLVTEESVKNAKSTQELYGAKPTEEPQVETKRGKGRPKGDPPPTKLTPVFPATYDPIPDAHGDALDLEIDLIMVKSWIRANSATKDEVYDSNQATQKLTALGAPIVQAVEDMLKTNTIRQLKKGRQRPGRNFEITQSVWNVFKRWPGEADGPSYLRSLAKMRAEVVKHFEENDTLEMTSGITASQTAVLNGLIAQGMLTTELRLPPRNDDVNAPGPKLNAWSYGGPRHDTRSIDRTTFQFPVVYSKTASFSGEHKLHAKVAIPSSPLAMPNEGHPRVPFWIDIHGNVIAEIWEKVLSSVLYLLVTKPGITAKGIEKAHKNKFWAWEIGILLEWMAEVGVAERFGPGKEVDGVWKGGWTAGDDWYCVFEEGVAVGK